MFYNELISYRCPIIPKKNTKKVHGARTKNLAHAQKVEALRRLRAREARLNAIRAKQLRFAAQSELAIRDAFLDALEAKKADVLAAQGLKKAKRGAQVTERREAAAEGFSSLLRLLGVLTDRIVEEKQKRRAAEAAGKEQAGVYRRELEARKRSAAEGALVRLLGSLEARGRRAVEAQVQQAQPRVLKLVEA